MKSKDLRKVVELLESIAHLADREGSVDMGRGTVDVATTHPCKTVQCFGGWYAVARFWEWKGDKGSFTGPHLAGNGEGVDFMDGAFQMGKDLGLESDAALRLWAGQHPEFWGNTHGELMFFDGIAFGLRAYKDPSFRQIITHIETVADALEIWEIGEEMA